MFKKTLYILIVVAVVGYLAFLLTTKPSNTRDWTTDQAILPYADIVGNIITIHNIRNFDYTSTTDYTASYYDKTFDLEKIKKVYYIVEPFTDFKGAAHTFLSFEFEGDSFVSISVEIRKEKGESFSALKGLLRQYELMYVIADEKDVIKLRANYRKDQVYMYPVNTTKEKAASLFLDMVTRANELKAKPEFYNSLTNNCTTNIMEHVNTISPRKVPLSLKVLFPENSDKLAYDLGLIDTILPFDKARQKFLVNDKAGIYAEAPDFSAKIRQSELD